MANNKTLIFSFDGTGNEPRDAREFKDDESISNILKLHILMGGGIEADNSETKTPNGFDQKTYYYNGIGTREGGRRIPLLGRLISWGKKHINMAIAPSFGDARRILDEAKEDFEKEYKTGDKVVIFGFSRGAALARKFASKILAEKEDCHVSFLGVFDTVAAMNGIHRAGEKISSDVMFENGTLHEHVERAVHVVSLDEDRIPFTPTLINKDPNGPDRILEVWFPGVHSDIGGGYWYDGLSDITLKFMRDECKNTLGKDISIADGRKVAGIRQLFKDQKGGLEGLDMDDIVINPINGMMHTHSGLMAKAGDQEPRLVCVNVGDRPGKELPILHYSVKERFDDSVGYRPPALRGLKFKLMLEEGGYSEAHGISGLRAL